MKKITCFFFFFIFSFFSLVAQSNKTEYHYDLEKAGTLLDSIGIDNINSVVKLKIGGPLNGTDIATIRKMQKLSVLDMKDADIVEGGLYYMGDYKTSNDVIGSYFFSGLSALKSIILPSSSVTIERFAFANAPEIVEVVLSNATKTLDDYAFSELKKIEFISIPGTLEKIGTDCFKDCISLKEVRYEPGEGILPGADFSKCPLEKVFLGRDMGYSFFVEHPTLKEVTFAGTCTYAGGLRGCKNMEKVIILSEYVTSIYDNGFQDCVNLKSINLPLSVDTIFGGAFTNCFKLNNVVLPEKLSVIKGWAFYGCTSLTSINIPGSVEILQAGAFISCTALNKVTFEEGTKIIDEACFRDCSSLTNVEFSNTINKIGDYAFMNCINLKMDNLPDNLEEIGYGAFKNCRNITELSLPLKVTSLGGDSFKECENLTSITLHENLEEIGYNAFDKCINLKSITIPSSVNSINRAFSNCTSLESIYSKAVNPPLGGFFEGVNKSTCLLYVPKGSRTQYWLADGWNEFENIIEKDYTVSNNTIINENLKVYTATDAILIDTDRSLTAQIFTISGKLIQKVRLDQGLNTISISKGIYVVSIKDYNQKVIVK